MFGYSFIQLFFMTNMVYTIIMFFFLHNIVVEKIDKNYHLLTSRHMTEQEAQETMNIFYIFNSLDNTLASKPF